ncbi:MAG: penicillin-binding protein 2 [Syntrophomonadaceae bacterium]|nr:penicillin-binding protein 2 [Syntrophomonadaceae bacterium]MDD4550087.1 penicillin-binding protein 2 [Syntrophomonadaceae bacterium]
MFKRRIFIIMCIFLAVFFGLLANLFYYQIIKGHEIAVRAAGMRSREIELKEYARGEILDRNFLPLTSTATAKAVYCLPGEIAKSGQQYTASAQDTEESFAVVARVLAGAVKNLDSEEVLANLKYAYKNRIPFVRIVSDLNDKEAALVNASRLSGIVVAPVIKRYSETGFCAHIIGYVSGQDSAEGKAGLEKIYDNILRKQYSTQQLISVFDARGLPIQGLMFKVKNDQENRKQAIILTIDKRIQAVVEDTMNRKVKKGAVVVMDIPSREVLAIASRPTFNPYQVKSILKDNAESPLTNRALSRYHPGSLFKIVTAAAALEENCLDRTKEFECTGEYKFNEDVSIPCWKEAGHGKISFSEAFAYSCNPAFIDAAIKISRPGLLDYAQRLNVCDETLIGYDYHAGSYIKINPGEPALGNACLGQQGVMLTPLQITSLMATIADDGQWAPPSLVKFDEVNNVAGDHATGAKEQVLSVETARSIQEMMEMVVSKGTGKSAALTEVKVAGKTATSQTGSRDEDDQEILNTWFAGYLPADNPRWAIVVLVEEGKSGAEDAAPVFKDIARGILRYFSVNKAG